MPFYALLGARFGDHESRKISQIPGGLPGADRWLVQRLFPRLSGFATGLSVLYVCVQHIENVSMLEWLTVPLVFLVTNWFEWDLHKNFMHQQSSIKALQIIHRYHMLNHHQYFTDEDMHFHDHRDWRITIFPPYVITILILIAIPFAALVGLDLLAELSAGCFSASSHRW